MTFGEYLKRLLHRPVQSAKGGDIQRWMEALGLALDDAKALIFALRRAWIVRTATGQLLDEHGRERGVTRYPGESDDSYRRRILIAWEMYARGGTEPGMRAALARIGYPNAVIHELYKDGPVSPFHDGVYQYNGQVRHSGGVRWAEFSIRTGIDDDRSFTAQDAQILRDTVRRLKPAHTRMAALVFELAFQEFVPHRDGIELDVIFVAHALRELYPWEGHRHDGAATHSGGIRYDSVLDLAGMALELDLGADQQTTGGVLHNAWFRHDGSLRYGAHPAMLDTGGAVVVPRFQETADVADGGGTGVGLRLGDQFPDGPTLHNGVPRQAVRRYGQDRVLASGGQALTARLADTPAGTPTYGWSMLRHDGGGPAWRHNGRITRVPRYTHSGIIDHSGAAVRWQAMHRYGDRARLHNGLERYGRTIPRDGTWTHGANGPVDLFGIVVTRHGRPVAA